MSWGNPHVLWGLLLVPVLAVVFAIDGQHRRRVLERIGHLPMIARMTANSSPARRRWRAVLKVSAVALLVLALARPQMPGRARLTESRGLDLVVALDFSRSMLARDVYPSRLERAKAELARLVDSLHGDRVGLVAFAGETLSYPLTTDYEAAKLFWRDLGPDDIPVGGTDLGRALRAATDLLVRVRQPQARHRPAQVILLITDGEDTEGQGMAAASQAAKLGIKIYTLGIGTRERPYVQTYDAEGKPNGFISDQAGQPVRVGIDESALRQMAALSGGEYFAVDPQRFGVDEVQKAIATLERTEEEARLEREPDDVGRWFLLPAFLLLLGEACVRQRKRARRQAPPTERTGEAAPAERPAGAGVSRAAVALLLLALFPWVTGFDLLLRRDPDIDAGNRALQAGKPADALKAYDRAVTALPDEPVVRFDRGEALYQLGRYPEAQKEFQRAAEQSGQSGPNGRSDPQIKADAYYNMGNALFQQKRWQEAFEAYKHTLGLRPNDERAKWNLELALQRLEQEKKKQQQEQAQKKQQPKDQQQQQKDQQQQQQAQQQQQQQQAQQQQQQAQQQQQQQQRPQQTEDQTAERGEKPTPSQAAEVAKEPAREIDKEDAAAVLDALEQVEPTVQKDMARRRAGDRRAVKDW